MSDSGPRVIFVGDSGVGKTSLIHRAKNHKFNESTTPTIGAGITQMESLSDGKVVEYQLWDTAGQEIYRNIVPIYFKGAICAIIVFSMEERTSFLSLQSWVDQLMSHADESVGVVICGNKVDTEHAQVTQAEAEKWAQDRKFSIFFTSAFTGENVQLLIDYVVSTWVIGSRLIPTKSKVNIDDVKPGKKKCC